MPPITELCLSTLLHSATAEELKSAGVTNTDQPSLVIEDFTRGWRDWYRLNAEHRSMWQNWTRKISDPKWRGPDGARLAVTLMLPESNRMNFVLIENEWRNYRGKKQVFVCDRVIKGNPESQIVMLDLSDFKDTHGNSPNNWQQIDQLGICAHYEDRQGGKSSQPAPWHGDFPKFLRLEWQ
jgi:hypothetical protein